MQLPSSPTKAQEAYAIAAELESIAQQLVDQASAVMLRVERLQEQLSQSAQQELRLTQPQAGKIKRAKLLCVVHDRLPTYAKSGSTYKVRDFRKFCEPVLRPHLSALDYELDADNRPKWHGRFDYAHKDVARDLGCVIVSNGVWRAP